MHRLYLVFALSLVMAIPARLTSHETTRRTFEQTRLLAQAEANATAEDLTQLPAARCQLTINVIGPDTDEPVAAVVRLLNPATGKTLPLSGEIHRKLNWYSLDASSTVTLPQMRVRVEAILGLDTELATTEIDLTGKSQAKVTLKLSRFYDAYFRGLRSGNTHLHLMKLTHEEALRYLRVVPLGDALDLVYLSYLRRVPDERHYISNQIVLDSFSGGSLQRLSQHGVLFGNGEEHRHNFGRGGQGYGHVMLLDLNQLIQPVSLGPGIMGEGTDGIPLRQGIGRAREDQATVIWCHNTFGYEDIPNWMAGLIHAQNIYDGGTHGSYEDTFYRYLNLGLHVPFSTGTDWFIDDFSRVYVTLEEDLTSAKWLRELRDGRSFITNGPFLELLAERGGLGDTLTLQGPNRVSFAAKAMGRVDFGHLEMVYNGQVVDRVATSKEGGYFFAEKQFRVEITESGWVAIRVTPGKAVNELGRELFAHTSPIYVNVGDKPRFHVETARSLIEELRQSIEIIAAKGKFGNAAEQQGIVKIYEDTIRDLEQRIERAR